MEADRKVEVVLEEAFIPVFWAKNRIATVHPRRKHMVPSHGRSVQDTEHGDVHVGRTACYYQLYLHAFNNVVSWVRHVAMMSCTWKTCVRGCDILKKVEHRIESALVAHQLVGHDYQSETHGYGGPPIDRGREILRSRHLRRICDTILHENLKIQEIYSIDSAKCWPMNTMLRNVSGNSDIWGRHERCFHSINCHNGWNMDSIFQSDTKRQSASSLESHQSITTEEISDYRQCWENDVSHVLGRRRFYSHSLCSQRHQSDGCNLWRYFRNEVSFNIVRETFRKGCGCELSSRHCSCSSGGRCSSVTSHLSRLFVSKASYTFKSFYSWINNFPVKKEKKDS